MILQCVLTGRSDLIDDLIWCGDQTGIRHSYGFQTDKPQSVRWNKQFDKTQTDVWQSGLTEDYRGGLAKKKTI